MATLIIGMRCGLPYATSLLGSTLFLLSFAVPNLTLAAYVDSGELLFLTLLSWSLLSGRWYLLPLWGILGALAKETFAPFALAFAVVWWLAERPWRFPRLIWVAALAACAFGTVWVELSAVRSAEFGPLDFARWLRSNSG